MNVDLYSPWVVVIAVLLALATVNILIYWHGIPSIGSRYTTIDGLRGFLAFFVFLHHSSVWFIYIREQTWTLPASNLYRHLGETSVSLFFMITAFLFTAKLINNTDQPIDWIRLYVSRVMRLFPLYAIAIVVMCLMVIALTDWTLTEPTYKLLGQLFRWLTFTILGGGPINGFSETDKLMAGVTWSLPYEWWFYLCLPGLGLLLGRRTAWRWALPAFFNALIIRDGWHLAWPYLMPFLGGIAAAFAVRNQWLCNWAKQPMTGVIVVACLVGAVAGTPSAYIPTSVVLSSAAFILIACGNNLFGILSAAPSRMLGEMTYSIYLLHGLLLSFAFRWVFGPTVSEWSVGQHWSSILGLVVPLILLSYTTFRWIEVPAQKLAPPFIAWIRRHLQTLKGAGAA